MKTICIFCGIVLTLLLSGCQFWSSTEKAKGSSSETIQLDTAASIPNGQFTTDSHIKTATSTSQWPYATQVQILDK